MGWEKFAVELRRATTLFFSIHVDGSRNESQKQTFGHKIINPELEEKDPKQAYAVTLKKGVLLNLILGARMGIVQVLCRSSKFKIGKSLIPLKERCTVQGDGNPTYQVEGNGCFIVYENRLAFS